MEFIPEVQGGGQYKEVKDMMHHKNLSRGQRIQELPSRCLKKYLTT